MQPAALVTGDGRPSPDRLGREIAREIERPALVRERRVEVEREPDLAPTPCQAMERKRHEVLPLKGIGAPFAAVLSRKLAVMLHRMWRAGADFIWSSKEAAA